MGTAPLENSLELSAKTEEAHAYPMTQQSHSQVIPREVRAPVHQETCTGISTAALFLTAENCCKQPVYPFPQPGKIHHGIFI